MKDESHTARSPRAGVAGRAGLLTLLRSMTPGQMAAVVAWIAATAGFVAYLASLDSFKEAYGSVGTGALLLVWLTLFSILYYAMPSLRVSGVAPEEEPSPDPSPIVERVDLVVTPSAALRNVTAQGRMMSVLGAQAMGMTDREIDLMDWGFAFGVAWAVARGQDPDAPEDVVSERALHATQAVYEAYRGSRGPVLARLPAPVAAPNGGPNGSPVASAAQAHAHRG
jgi:hypothetical protein